MGQCDPAQLEVPVAIGDLLLGPFEHAGIGHEAAGEMVLPGEQERRQRLGLASGGRIAQHLTHGGAHFGGAGSRPATCSRQRNPGAMKDLPGRAHRL